MTNLHAPLAPVGANLDADRQVLLDIRMGTPLHCKHPTRASFTLHHLGHVPAHHMVQCDFVMCLPRIAQYHRRPANVFQQQVASKQFLCHSMSNFDRYRRSRNPVAHQSHANFLRVDCRAPLARQARIHQQKLPCRRRPYRDDAVLSTFDLKVDCTVPHILERGPPIAHLKSYVLKK